MAILLERDVGRGDNIRIVQRARDSVSASVR